jgi:hypothetical protein
VQSATNLSDQQELLAGEQVVVMKGQLGQVVSIQKVTAAAVAAQLQGNVVAGAVGVAASAARHLAGAGQESAVHWPVVEFRNKHGLVTRVVVPHVTVRESRWFGCRRAMHGSSGFCAVALGVCRQLPTTARHDLCGYQFDW